MAQQSHVSGIVIDSLLASVQLLLHLHLSQDFTVVSVFFLLYISVHYAPVLYIVVLYFTFM